jgi:tetratricopeptide (TPR) repeat protein
MEFLRTAFFSVLLFIFSSGLLLAQESDKTYEAFKESYSFEADGQYTDALNVLRTIYHEESYEINARLGWLSYMAGLFTESVAYYEKAIALKPYALEPRFGIVNPAAALGNWNIVINQYKKILETDPQNTTANYRLGMIHYGRESYEEAGKYFEKVVNLYPYDYESLLMFAWCKFQTGKLREAEVLFNKVLLIDPENESAKEGLSLIK